MNKFNLGKVRGEAGKSATIAIGTVRTGQEGSDASVDNAGDSLRAIFDFTIPRGDKGEKGDRGNEAYTAGSNVQISGGVISATDTTYAPATPAADGLMSKEDKVRLDDVQPWATAPTQDAAQTAFGMSATGKAVATGTPAQGRAALLLGTAATATLTTSNTDGTAGRVLKVGDGGWMGRGVIQSTPYGYPANINDVTNQTKVIRSSVPDTGVGNNSAGIHFAAQETWGRLRVNWGGPVAWIQGGHSNFGTGWTSQVVLSDNILQTTGTSTDFPMSQKAVTDAINGVSDMRDKTESQEFGIGLELIEELDVIKYKLNKRDWYRAQEAKQTKIVTQTDADGNETTEEVEEVDNEILTKPLTDYDANDGSLARDDYYTGLSAQAVKAKLVELGMREIGLVKKYDEEYEDGEDRYYIEQLGLLPFLINSVKQLSAQNKALVERVEHLESVND